MISTILIACSSQLYLALSKVPVLADEVSITLSRVPGSATFIVTAANRSNRPIAFYKYPWAWEVKVLDARYKILSNESGYKKGGLDGGIVYHAPHLTVTTRYDWTVLMPGEQVSFRKGVFRVSGPVRDLKNARWAELCFVESNPATLMPSWIDKSEVGVMHRPPAIRIALGPGGVPRLTSSFFTKLFLSSVRVKRFLPAGRLLMCTKWYLSVPLEKYATRPSSKRSFVATKYLYDPNSERCSGC